MNYSMSNEDPELTIFDQVEEHLADTEAPFDVDAGFERLRQWISAPAKSHKSIGRPELRFPPVPLWRRFVAYLALTALTTANAMGFSTTLVAIDGGETVRWTVFTVALTTGAVFGAHEVGRLVRAKREGADAHTGWIAVLTLLWFSLGAAMFWLRSGQVVSTGVQNELQGGVSTVDPNSIKVACLLLVLYLLTGALAGTTAYRFGNSRFGLQGEADEVRARLRTSRSKLQYVREPAEAARRAHRDPVDPQTEFFKSQAGLDTSEGYCEPRASDGTTRT